ncbi:unnamed protein product [Paramecium sonneborni]|uniref:C2H2-type domain-containing protein n=1 Tax=Paramecium sonneborni TaxID=65129 RepID=A0A8S1K590_9CILI|nr:unnamed protein product [Paramecium sonneborni]
MNNLDFVQQVGLPAIKLLELLKDLLEELNYLNDDELLLQKNQKVNIEDPFNFLDLKSCTLEQEYSNELFYPVIIQEKGKKTKKNNYIFENNQKQYQCGNCKKTFEKYRSLGGHIQKRHKKDLNQQSLACSFQLRKRLQK